jgi:hypothetical protein
MNMIRLMSAGGDSARSEVSLIEAFERAISRMDSFSETSQSNTLGSGVSGYDRFKDWEQLWKSDPIVPNRAPDKTPIIPTPDLSSHTTIPVINPDPAASFFGLDNFPYSCPQVLEEFSAIPTFEYDFDSIQGTQWGSMDRM